MIRVAAVLLALTLLSGPLLAASALLPDPAEFPVDSPQMTLAQISYGLAGPGLDGHGPPAASLPGRPGKKSPRIFCVKTSGTSICLRRR